MSNSGQVSMFVSSLVGQLPVLLVSVIGVFIVIARWKATSPASLWALLGFGLSAALCIVVPAVQTLIQTWMMENQDNSDFARRASMYTGLSLLWSLLRAASYGLLLVAVLAGRSKAET